MAGGVRKRGKHGGDEGLCRASGRGWGGRLDRGILGGLSTGTSPTAHSGVASGSFCGSMSLILNDIVVRTRMVHVTCIQYRSKVGT